MGSILRLALVFLPEISVLLGIMLVYLVNMGMFGLFESSEEIYYIQAAREMFHLGHWAMPTFNQADFLEKPPLYIWMVLAGFKAFGVSLFMARLPSLIFALLSLALTYVLAWTMFDNRHVAIFSSVIMATSWGFFKAAHVTTPNLGFVALLLMVTLVFWFWFNRANRPQGYLFELRWAVRVLGALFGLLVLLKSSVGFLFPLLLVGVFLLMSGTWRRLEIFNWQGFLFVMALIALPWLIWVTYQDGHQGYLLDFFFRYPFADLGRMFLPENWLRHAGDFLVIFLPWTLFVLGPFLSYFRRRGRASRTIIDFQSEQVQYLLVWTVLALCLFGTCPVLIVPPLCLITALYVVNALQEPAISRSFVMATDITVLMSMTLAVVMTFAVFQVLPDDYPGVLWQLPGPAQLEYLFTPELTLSSAFPLWKVWLLPFSVLFLVTGFLLSGFLALQRYAWIPDTLAWAALIFCFLFNTILNPVFSRPVGEHLAQQVNARQEAGDKVFLYGEPGDLSSPLVRALFSLDFKPGSPWAFVNTPEALTQLVKASDHGERLYGILNEDGYYQLSASVRQGFRVVSREWQWLVSPFANSEKGKTRDYILLLEELPNIGQSH